MNGNQNDIPPRLREIIEDFQFVEGREKVELLLEYSERMQELPSHMRDRQDIMEQIEECMTPVFVKADVEPGSADGQPRLTFFFDVPRESPTVRGYAAILAEGVNGSTPEAILKIPNDFYMEMGLHEVLTSQRLNGIAAILAHLKRLALAVESDTQAE